MATNIQSPCILVCSIDMKTGYCFGCGRNNEHGHQIKTFVDGDQTLTEFEPAKYYLGGGQVAYGGIIASIIDCHCASTR